MKKVFAGVFSSVLCLAAAPAMAQSYPNKPIRLIVPLAPGGTADVLGRILGQKLGEKYGQTVIVENKPGVGGNIGAEFVARAPADGYTLLFGTLGIHSTYQIYPKLNYNPPTDLKPITILAETPNILVVSKEVKMPNTAAIIKEAQANPNTLFFGSAGFGSSTHIAGELFKYQAKAPISHIPYKGSGPALTDLAGGRLQMMFENLPTALPLIKSGQIRAVAVTSPFRVASLPDTPTIAEDGLPGYAFTAWFSISAPAGTPDAIVQKLNHDINAIMNAPDMKERLDGMSVIPGKLDVAATDAFINAETEKFGKLIKDAHITAE